MTIQDVDNIWGPLATPIHADVPEDRPPWKDNAYLAFWDPEAQIVGVAHVSTSPNASGRRARLSLSIADRRIEIIEDLESATFTSASIAFGLDEVIHVDSDRVSGTIESTPLFEHADYGRHSIIPPLVEGQPVQHFQQAAIVKGTLTVDGQPLSFEGRGLRDRTWGYREESTNLDEYIAILLVSNSWALTAMRFRSTSGVDLTEGYVLGSAADEQPRVVSIDVTRDAAGLLAAAGLATVTAESTTLTRTESLGGFWVPMGWTKSGPAMSAYDEFVQIQTDTGDVAYGVVEHGILRQLH